MCPGLQEIHDDERQRGDDIGFLFPHTGLIVYGVLRLRAI